MSALAFLVMSDSLLAPLFPGNKSPHPHSQGLPASGQGSAAVSNCCWWTSRARDEETGPWTWVTRTDRNYRDVGKYRIKARWGHQLCARLQQTELLLYWTAMLLCALRPTRRSEIFLGAISLQFGSFPRMSQEEQNNSALNVWKDESRGDTGTAGGICSDTQGVEPHWQKSSLEALPMWRI